jgi:ribosome modulation factor
MRNTLEGYGTLQAVDDYEFEFNEGRQAFLDGLTEDDCPYAERRASYLGQNRSRDAWMSGFYLTKKARRGYSAVEKVDAVKGLHEFESRGHTEADFSIPKPLIPPKRKK